MRKKVRGVCVGAATDVVDRRRGNPDAGELRMNEHGKVPVGPFASLPSHRALASDALQLGRNLLTDFEGGDAYVRTHRDQELARIVAERTKRVRHDTGDRAAPPSVNRSYVPGAGMRNEQRDAVGRARGHGDAWFSGKKRIPFGICDGRRVVQRRHRTHFDPVDLALLE